MPTPLEKLTTDWRTHYSDMPLEEFVNKVHQKMYADIPFSDFTDKLGLTAPSSPINEDLQGVTGPPIEGVVNQGGDTSGAGKLIVEGAAGAPFYGIPYAGPAVGGVVSSMAGSAYDYLAGKDVTLGGAAKDAARNAAFGYVVKGGEKVLGAISKAAAPLESQITSTIKEGIQKGIRPSVIGKSNAKQAEAYYNKAQSAVETIIENKPNLQFADEAGQIIKGELPQNLSQFSHAIDQTKREVFSQYDSIIKGAEGGSVDLAPIVSELEKYGGSKIAKMVGGSGPGRSAELADNMKGQTLTLSETQELIAALNNRLKSFYKNPSPDMAGAAAADALAANNLRSALDKAVEGSGYQALKNQYGALREIEKEVASRAIVDARKNTKGLIDFADIASAAEAARALATMNPGAASASAAIKGMQMYYRYLNNPNRIVNKMFSDTERLMLKRANP